MKAAQAKFNEAAEKARNEKFRTRFADLQKSAALGVDPESVAQQLNKLIKEYDTLPEHFRI